MLPTACNMPDLSSLDGQSAQSSSLLYQLVGAGNGFPPAIASYRRNMVRLADKAVHDYTEVRNAVLAQIAEAQRPPSEIAKGRQIYMFRAVDKLEDCIITVQRLFRYFERVKSDSSRFPLDRVLKKRLASVEKSIRDTRNLIEHLDDDIRSASIQAGQNTAPVLDAEAKKISLASVQLPVETLARAIRHFHEFAHEFAKYRVTPEGQYELMPRSGPVGSAPQSPPAK